MDALKGWTELAIGMVVLVFSGIGTVFYGWARDMSNRLLRLEQTAHPRTEADAHFLALESKIGALADKFDSHNQAMNNKLDAMNLAVIRIATKLEIDHGKG